MLNKSLSSKELIQFRYFFIILTLFSATWLISDIAAIKLVLVFGITLTGGFITFPFTTMLSTLIVEVYGYKNSRQAIWSGFILNLTFIFFMNLVNVIPSSPNWKLQNEFNSILVPDTRIILASLISFSLSDFSNSYFMAKMKVKTQGKSLIKRILISYVLSLSLDIVSFMILAFSGSIPTFLLVKLTIAAYVKKISCQIILLPLLWYLIELLKNKEGVEIYDIDTKFNPFSTDNLYELKSYNNISKNPIVKKPIINFSER